MADQDTLLEYQGVDLTQIPDLKIAPEDEELFRSLRIVPRLERAERQGRMRSLRAIGGITAGEILSGGVRLPRMAATLAGGAARLGGKMRGEEPDPLTVAGIAEQAGLPVEFVRRHYSQLRDRNLDEQARLMAENLSPRFYNWYRLQPKPPDRSAVEEMSGLVWAANVAARNFGSGMLQQELALTRFTQMIAGHGDSSDAYARQLRRRIEEWGQDYGAEGWIEHGIVEWSRMAPFTLGTAFSMTAGGVVGGATGLLAGPEGVPVGATVGSAAGGYLYVSAVEAGLAYDELLEVARELDPKGEHITREELVGTALGIGAINGLLEYASARTLLKMLGGEETPLVRRLGQIRGFVAKSGAKRLSAKIMRRILGDVTLRRAMATHAARLAESVSTETLTEVLQEITPILAEWMIKQRAVGSLDIETELVDAADRLAEVAVATAQAVSVGGLPFAGIHSTTGWWRARRAKRALEAAVMLQMMAEGAKKAKGTTKPEAFRALIDTLGEDLPEDTIWIDRERWNAYWEERGESPVDRLRQLGVSEEEATAPSLTVALPLTEYLKQLADTEHHEALLPDIRVNPGAATLREADEYMREQQASQAPAQEPEQGQQQPAQEAAPATEGETTERVSEDIAQYGLPEEAREEVLRDDQGNVLVLHGARSHGVYYADPEHANRRVLAGRADDRVRLSPPVRRTVVDDEGTEHVVEMLDTNVPGLSVMAGTMEVVHTASGRPLVPDSSAPRDSEEARRFVALLEDLGIDWTADAETINEQMQDDETWVRVLTAAELAREGGGLLDAPNRVRAVAVAARNVLDLGALGTGAVSLDQLAGALRERGVNVSRDALGPEDRRPISGVLADPSARQAIIDAARAAGYDAVRFMDAGPGLGSSVAAYVPVEDEAALALADDNELDEDLMVDTTESGEVKANRWEPHIGHYGADYDALTGELREVIDEMIDQESAAPAKTRQLLRLYKGTLWAHHVLSGLGARHALLAYMEGRKPRIGSLLNQPSMSAFRADLEARGEEAIWDFIRRNGAIGHAAKPVNSIPGSFAQCFPTKPSALYSYAVRGQQYAAVHVRGELSHILATRRPERYADAIAAEYKTMLEFDGGWTVVEKESGVVLARIPEGPGAKEKAERRMRQILRSDERPTVLAPDEKGEIAPRKGRKRELELRYVSQGAALRLFDRSDGDLRWIRFTDEMAKRGIRLHIFTKHLEFLRKIDPFHLRLFSLDWSNRDVAEKHPNQPYAFVYTGTDEEAAWLTKMVREHPGSIQLVLPVIQGKRHLTREELMKLPPEIRSGRLCPVDTGTVSVGAAWGLIDEDGSVLETFAWRVPAKKDKKTGVAIPEATPEAQRVRAEKRRAELEKKLGRKVTLRKLQHHDCSRCDKNGGIGCYYGIPTKKVLAITEFGSGDRSQAEALRLQAAARAAARAARRVGARGVDARVSESVGIYVRQILAGLDPGAEELGDSWDGAAVVRDGPGEEGTPREAEPGTAERADAEETELRIPARERARRARAWLKGYGLDLVKAVEARRRQFLQKTISLLRVYDEAWRWPKKSPKTLVGVKLKTIEQIALAAGIIRSPFAETMLVLYVGAKTGRVHEAQAFSSGATGFVQWSPGLKPDAVYDMADSLRREHGEPITVVLSHNHPGGKPSPSDDDKRVQAHFRRVFSERDKDRGSPGDVRLGPHVVLDTDEFGVMEATQETDPSTGRKAVAVTSWQQALPRPFDQPWDKLRSGRPSKDMPQALRRVSAAGDLVRIAANFFDTSRPAHLLLFLNSQNELVGVDVAPEGFDDWETADRSRFFASRSVFYGATAVASVRTLAADATTADRDIARTLSQSLMFEHRDEMLDAVVVDPGRGAAFPMRSQVGGLPGRLAVNPAEDVSTYGSGRIAETPSQRYGSAAKLERALERATKGMTTRERNTVRRKVIERVEALSVTGPFATLDQIAQAAMMDGLTDAETQELVDMIDDAQRRAIEAIIAEEVRVIAAQREREMAERRRRIQAEVERRLYADPAYRFIYWAQTGKMPEGYELPDAIAGRKVSRQSIIDAYGEEALEGLPRPAVYAKDGDLHIDEVAQYFGFDDGAALLDAIRNREPRNRVIKREVNARVEAAARGLATEAKGRLRDVIEKDFAGAAFRRFLRTLARLAGKPVPPRRVLRAGAEATIARTPIKQLDPRQFLEEERAAAARVMDALAAGDYARAYEAAIAQARAHELWLAARRAQLDAARTLRVAREMTSKSGIKRLGKAGARYVDMLRALVDGMTFTRRDARTAAKLARLQRYIAEEAAEGRDVLVPPQLLEALATRTFEDLTVEEARNLRAALLSLRRQASRKRYLLSVKRLIEMERAREEIRRKLRELGGPDRPISWDPNVLKWLEYLQDKARWLAAENVKREQIIEWLDGGAIGPFTRLLWQPIENAEAEKDKLYERLNQRIYQILSKVPSRMRRRMMSGDEVYIKGIGQTMSWAGRIGVALNLGNRSNLDKLMRGGFVDANNDIRPLTREDVQEIVDTLNEDDWRLVQEIWSMLDEELWPRVVELERRLNGFAPPKVEAERPPFDGVPEFVRGGYWPVAYDWRAGGRAAQKQDTENPAAIYEQGNARALTPHSHVYERTGYAAPINIDFERVLTAHLQMVLHDLTHREAVLDVWRLLNDPQVKRDIIRYAGEPIWRTLNDWVKAVANGPVHNLGRSRFWLGVRSNATLAAMGYKATTMIGNLAGIANLSERLPFKYYARGLALLRSDWARYYRFVMDQSKEMPLRLKNYDAQFRMRAEQLFGRRMNRIKLWAYQGIVMTEFAVTLPGWIGAYEYARTAKERGGLGLSHDDAVEWADRVIRTTQGAGGTKDMTRAQQRELLHWWTMFFTFAAAQFSRTATWTRDAARAVATLDVKSFPRIVMRAWFLFFLGPILQELLSGRAPDPDDDESWASWVLSNLVNAPLMGIPVVRDAIGGIAYTIGTGRRGKFRGTPALRVFEAFVDTGTRLVEAAQEEDKTLADALPDAAEFVGLVFGAPVGQIQATGGYALDVMTGRPGSEKYETALDHLSGILYGRPVPEPAPLVGTAITGGRGRRRPSPRRRRR